LSTASIAVPEAFRYIFWAIATTGDRHKEAVMDWGRTLAYVTGTVDQELLARNEYLATENRILKNQLKGRLMLSDAERATLGEIGHRLVARFSPRLQPSLARYRKLVARKFSGSQARQGPGRPRASSARWSN
jgi:putative transposase